MQIETYECEEVANETMEMSDEARRLIDELGLEGQKTLICGETKQDRLPYREMTKEERLVFRIMCPIRTELTKYSSETIPLRVLQVAAHVKSLEIFTELQVWHRESAMIKDPVLVGLKKGGYERKYYILARWGEVLDEYPALVREATRRAVALAKANLTEKIVDLQNKLNSVGEHSSIESLEAHLEFSWW